MIIMHITKVINLQKVMKFDTINVLLYDNYAVITIIKKCSPLYCTVTKWLCDIKNVFIASYISNFIIKNN